MADELKILIKTGFNVDIAELTRQLEAIQEKNKLNLGGDLTKQIRQAKELAALENKQLQNEKVKLQNERLSLQNEKVKTQTSQNSEKSTLQTEKLRLQNERLALQNEMSIIQKEKSSKTDQETQKIARQNEVYSNLLKLVKEQYQIETKLLTEKDAKLQQQLTKELEINKARQSTYNNSVKNEGLFNVENESKLLTQQYNLKQKLLQQEKELADAKRASTQFSSQGLAQSFYENIIKLSKDYNNNLISSIDLKKKLDALIYKRDGSTVSQFNNLDTGKQDQINSIYSKATMDAQNKAYTELNRLLNEEYSIRMRIEEAKLQRYQVASDDKDAEKRVTLLEQELQSRLQVNQTKRDGINTDLNNSGLVNQEKLNTLVEQENRLKSELLIKQNQMSAAQQVSTQKSEHDLEIFKRSMQVQTEGLSRKYSYVGGASSEIEKYRQTLAGVTAENGKWYISQKQADGTMQQTAVTAQQLRMQYREMRNEIQGSIGIIDTFKNNLGKFMNYFMAGGVVVQGIRQIKSMFSYTNEMDKYLTNVQIITGKTSEQVSGLTQEYINLGKTLGAVSTNVAQIAEDFYRQGKSAEETKKLIEATTMMSQLAGMGTAESTEYMTSIMNGFRLNVEDMENTVSKLVAVDNTAATSVSELSEAISKVSAVAYESGVSFDSLLGYVGTVSETTRQNAESIGKQNCRHVQKCA